MRRIENLPLHDAIVDSINVNWVTKEVVINLKVFSKKGENAIPHSLIFKQVKSIKIPHESPWGESESINSASVESGICQIEMQSGDVISILAKDFRFVQSAS